VKSAEQVNSAGMIQNLPILCWPGVAIVFEIQFDKGFTLIPYRNGILAVLRSDCQYPYQFVRLRPTGIELVERTGASTKLGATAVLVFVLCFPI
jgi:hypothetical protein